MITKPLILATCSLLLGAGCATHPRQSATTAPLPGGLASYGKVGLVMDDYPIAINFHNASKGDSARAGFTEGVAEGVDWMNTAAEGTTPLVFIGSYYGLIPYAGIRAASSAVGALGGIATGTITGVSAPAVQRAEGAFHKARVAFPLQAGVEQHLLARVAEGERGVVLSSREFRATHSGRTALFEAMRREGFDTAMEVTVLGAALRNNTAASTRLSLRVPAYIRLVRLSDGRQLHSFTVEYLSPRSAARSLDVWAADDARSLQEELARCSAALATKIAEKILPPAQLSASLPLATTKE